MAIERLRNGAKPPLLAPFPFINTPFFPIWNPSPGLLNFRALQPPAASPRLVFRAWPLVTASHPAPPPLHPRRHPQQTAGRHASSRDPAALSSAAGPPRPVGGPSKPVRARTPRFAARTPAPPAAGARAPPPPRCPAVPAFSLVGRSPVGSQVTAPRRLLFPPRRTLSLSPAAMPPPFSRRNRGRSPSSPGTASPTAAVRRIRRPRPGSVSAAASRTDPRPPFGPASSRARRSGAGIHRRRSALRRPCACGHTQSPRGPCGPRKPHQPRPMSPLLRPNRLLCTNWPKWPKVSEPT
nr:nascent polypeptide-associated complex subunit alpha, muscle-specific form-like [Aegilops tauschii subsp. strangulata]